MLTKLLFYKMLQDKMLALKTDKNQHEVLKHSKDCVTLLLCKITIFS